MKRGQKAKFSEEQLATIQELAAEGATQEEISSAVGCCRQTLAKAEDARAAYDAGLNDMKLSLRHFQFLQAKSGNTTMLIWLGKQYLGQREQPVNADNRISDDMAEDNALLRGMFDVKR